jgi:hypothetical protein
MIRALAPSVLPEITRSKNEFTTHAVINQPMTPLDSIRVAEALANSEEVKRVTGMSYDELVRRLGTEYNFARNRPSKCCLCIDLRHSSARVNNIRATN